MQFAGRQSPTALMLIGAPACLFIIQRKHRLTKQFYIGYREKNTVPSDQDLVKYRTSSKIVKPAFDQFDWIIVAEFFNGNDAYAFEQELINTYWGNPLLLNKHCHYNQTPFKSCKGKKGPMIGKVAAKNALTGESVGVVSLNDPRLASGEIVNSKCGNKQSKQTVEKRLANTDKNKLRSMLGKTGNAHPSYGSILSAEHKSRISSKVRGVKKPEGFGKGVKNSNYGRRHPGLNAGEKNHKFGKVGELHHNFGKHMDINSRLRGNEELYMKVACLLSGGKSVKEVVEITNTSKSLVYRIKSKDHAIWKYIEELCDKD